MAAKTLTRAVLLGLLVGLAACGGKKQEEAPAAVDLAAIRAKRDSVRRVAQQDSLARARFKTCSDSVTAALAKAARGKKPTAPTSLIPPEVIRACGNPPPAPAVLAQKPDTTRPAGTAADTGRKPGAATQTARADTGRKPATAAPAAQRDSTRIEAPAKPTQAAAPAVQPPKPA